MYVRLSYIYVFATPFFNDQFALYNWRKYSNIYFKRLNQDISSVYKSSGLTLKIFLVSAYTNCSGMPHVCSLVY